MFKDILNLRKIESYFLRCAYVDTVKIRLFTCKKNKYIHNEMNIYVR